MFQQAKNGIEMVNSDQFVIGIVLLFLFTDGPLKYVATLLIIDYLKGFNILLVAKNHLQQVFRDITLGHKKRGPEVELHRTPKNFRLLKVSRVGNNCREFVFATNDTTRALNLPTGQHIHIHCSSNGEDIRRSYTPTEYKVPGSFTVLMKCYPGGKMGTYMSTKKAGDRVMISGPVGHLTYEGNGKFKSGKHSITIRKLCICAGGTGLTPAFQILKHVQDNPHDNLQILFLYASSTEQHILLQEELEVMNKDPRITVAHTVSRPISQDWDGYSGRVCKDIFDDFYGQGIDLESSLDGFGAGYCGPPKFEKVVKELFTDMGFEKNISLFRW